MTCSIFNFARQLRMANDPPDPCPKNKRFFFEDAKDSAGQDVTDVLTGLAEKLDTNVDFLFALSSWESGLDDRPKVSRLLDKEPHSPVHTGLYGPPLAGLVVSRVGVPLRTVDDARESIRAARKCE